MKLKSKSTTAYCKVKAKLKSWGYSSIATLDGTSMLKRSLLVANEWTPHFTSWTRGWKEMKQFITMPSYTTGQKYGLIEWALQKKQKSAQCITSHFSYSFLILKGNVTENRLIKILKELLLTCETTIKLQNYWSVSALIPCLLFCFSMSSCPILLLNGIGNQSFANGVSHISKKIRFDWCGNSCLLNL